MLSFPITVAYAVLHGLLWLFGVLVMVAAVFSAWVVVRGSMTLAFRKLNAGKYTVFGIVLYAFALLSVVQVIMWIL
jgi:hypothetical protein